METLRGGNRRGLPPGLVNLKTSPPGRILYVHNSADLYGASRSLMRLLTLVRQRGVQPSVLLPETGPLTEVLAESGVEATVDPDLAVMTRGVLRSPRLILFLAKFPLSVWRLSRRIKRGKFALVHTNTGVILSPAFAASLAGVPHVWHVRDSFLEFRSLWQLYRRYITGWSGKVIAVSNPIAAQFGGARNVVVIHNGIPLSEFQEDAAAAAQLRTRYSLGDDPIVGCVGRIKFVRKGQEILVQAAALLKKRGLRARYLIVGAPAPGSDDHLPKLERLIAELDLRDDVILAGEMPDPRPAYAAMDVLVLPSAQPEPFGGVVLEAMAMRRPVVATAVGGSLDQVEDERTGFLVPPGNAIALADKLAVLLADPALRRAMGAAGRTRLEAHFTADQMLEKILGVYDELLRKQ
jgi:glycosyltransferase involved in cell wall biosynthesis